MDNNKTEPPRWAVPLVMGGVDEEQELGITFQDKMKGILKGLKDRKKLFLERTTKPQEASSTAQGDILPEITQDATLPDIAQDAILPTPAQDTVLPSSATVLPSVGDDPPSSVSDSASPVSALTSSSSSSTTTPVTPSIPFDYSPNLPPSFASASDAPPAMDLPSPSCCFCSSSSSSSLRLSIEPTSPSPSDPPSPSSSSCLDVAESSYCSISSSSCLSRDACPSSFTSRSCSSSSSKKKRSTSPKALPTPRFFHTALPTPPQQQHSSIEATLAELFSASSSRSSVSVSSDGDGKVEVDLTSEQDFISFSAVKKFDKVEEPPVPHSFDGPRELLAPWAVGRSYEQANTSLRLHEELLDFYAYMSAKPEEEAQRQRLLDRITALIQNEWPEAKVQPFGSFVSKLYLPFGDLDLVVFGIDEEDAMGDLADLLKRSGMAKKLQVVSGAKIPIIKFKDAETGVAVDICLEQMSGIETTKFVTDMQHEIPAMRPLVMFLKYFLYCRSLHDTYSGGVGSYLLQIMVTNFLQLHPSYSFKPHPPASRSAQQDVNLGCLLMSFLQLYGHEFNYHNVGLSVQNKGSYFNKSARGWFNPEKSYLIAVENPLAPDLDIGKNAWGIQKIQKAFKYAIQRLGADNTSDGSTLLSQIVSVRRELLRCRPLANLPEAQPQERPVGANNSKEKKPKRKKHVSAESADLRTPSTKKRRKNLSATPVLKPTNVELASSSEHPPSKRSRKKQQQLQRQQKLQNQKPKLDVDK